MADLYPSTKLSRTVTTCCGQKGMGSLPAGESGGDDPSGGWPAIPECENVHIGLIITYMIC